jgi:hypothetical protein
MPNSEEPRTRSWSAEKCHNQLENSIRHAFSKGILPNIPTHFFAKHFPEEFGWPTKEFQSIIWIRKRPSTRVMTDVEALPPVALTTTSPTPWTSSAVAPSASESSRKQSDSAKACLNFVAQFMRGDQIHLYAEQNYANSY